MDPDDSLLGDRFAQSLAQVFASPRGKAAPTRTCPARSSLACDSPLGPRSLAFTASPLASSAPSQALSGADSSPPHAPRQGTPSGIWSRICSPWTLVLLLAAIELAQVVSYAVNAAVIQPAWLTNAAVALGLARTPLTMDAPVMDTPAPEPGDATDAIPPMPHNAICFRGAPLFHAADTFCFSGPPVFQTIDGVAFAARV